jgi:hypothetical protein
VEVEVNFKGVWNVEKLLRLLLDTLELLVLDWLIRVVGEVNLSETTLLKPLKRRKHTLKPKHFLSQLLDVHLNLLNILLNVDDGHCIVLI